MKMEFVRGFAFVLIVVGVVVIVFAVFQGFFYDKELSVVGGTVGAKGVGEFEALRHSLMWFFTLLTELVGGFFLATIGTKIIKK